MTEEYRDGQLVYVGLRQTSKPKEPAYTFMLPDQYGDGEPELSFYLKGWKAAQKPSNIGGLYDTAIKYTDGEPTGIRGGLTYTGQIDDHRQTIVWAGIDRTARNVKDDYTNRERAATKFASDKLLAKELEFLQDVVSKCRTYNEAHAMTEAIQRELMKGWTRR